MKRPRTALLILASLLAMLTVSATTPTDALAVAATIAQADSGNPAVKVWVNSNSGVYHCPGTRWYGNTKHGEYMTQAEAQKKGYRPAYGKVCR